MTTEKQLTDLAHRATELCNEAQQALSRFQWAARQLDSLAISANVGKQPARMPAQIREALSELVDAAEYLNIEQAANRLLDEGDQIADAIEGGEDA